MPSYPSSPQTIAHFRILWFGTWCRVSFISYDQCHCSGNHHCSDSNSFHPPFSLSLLLPLFIPSSLSPSFFPPFPRRRDQTAKMQFGKMSKSLGEKASMFKQLLEQDKRAEELYQSRVNTPGNWLHLAAERLHGFRWLPSNNIASFCCLATTIFCIFLSIESVMQYLANKCLSVKLVAKWQKYSPVDQRPSPILCLLRFLCFLLLADQSWEST